MTTMTLSEDDSVDGDLHRKRRIQTATTMTTHRHEAQMTGRIDRYVDQRRERAYVSEAERGGSR